MIELNTWDSSVLARIAQYQELPFERRWQMLREAKTDEARWVGLALLKEQLSNREQNNSPQETAEFMAEWNNQSQHISSDVLETAQALRSWSAKSRHVRYSRSAAVR